ncbi:MAG: rubredoxin [Promethearchaeota archaeon]
MNEQKNHGVDNMKIHRCKRCNYLYVDEEQKIPFEKIGDEWKCPKCRSSKKFFIEKEITENN